MLAAAVLAACGSARDADATAVPSERVDPAAAMALDRRGAALPAEERAERQTRYLTRRLSLREAQVDTVRALALDYAQRAEALRTSRSQDPQLRAGAMRELFRMQTASYREVLDDAQFAEYETLQGELRRVRQARTQQGNRAYDPRLPGQPRRRRPGW